jgi:hypothetical protein
MGGHKGDTIIQTGIMYLTKQIIFFATNKDKLPCGHAHCRKVNDHTKF